MHPFLTTPEPIVVDRLLVCPTLCGCQMVRRTVIEHRPRRLPGFYRQVTTFDGVSEILTACADHAPLSPDAMWAEMRHLKGNAWRPDTCGCSVTYWWDDRAPEIVHVPVDHPLYTERCALHAGCGDHVAHYRAVVADNQSKNRLVNATAISLGMRPEDVPWTRTADGLIAIDKITLPRRAVSMVKKALGVTSPSLVAVR